MQDTTTRSTPVHLHPLAARSLERMAEEVPRRETVTYDQIALAASILSESADPHRRQIGRTMRRWVDEECGLANGRIYARGMRDGLVLAFVALLSGCALAAVTGGWLP